jgi:multidrug resistance efflux pump
MGANLDHRLRPGGRLRRVHVFTREETCLQSPVVRLAAEAPAVKQAEAKLEATKRDLALAELDLRYCDVVAEIDGVVTR